MFLTYYLIAVGHQEISLFQPKKRRGRFAAVATAAVAAARARGQAGQGEADQQVR